MVEVRINCFPEITTDLDRDYHYYVCNIPASGVYSIPWKYCKSNYRSRIFRRIDDRLQ